MMRSIGAIAFGIASDRYGRKWPYVVNMVLFIILELATGFCQTFEQFLGVRAVYGIAMGGLYGNAAATALEDCPAAARGLLSGLLQQGYAFGYLLATVFSRGLVDTTPHGWRPLYWFGACPPLLLIVFRLLLPETQAYQERSAVRGATGNLTNTFAAEGKVALRRHWKLLLYLVLLMAGFNFMSHGSQDLYPTMLTNQYGQTPDQVTITQVVANLGAMVGGTIVGYLSQMFGRRFSIIVASVVGGALLYPYSFTGNLGIIAAAFFEQFCVQGAWVSPSPLGKVCLCADLVTGRYPYSPDGAFSRLFPHLRGGHELPAWQLGQLCQLHYRSYHRRALPLTAQGIHGALQLRHRHCNCKLINFSSPSQLFERTAAECQKFSSWAASMPTSSSLPSLGRRHWAVTSALRRTRTWRPPQTAMRCWRRLVRADPWVLMRRATTDTTRRRTERSTRSSDRLGET